MHVLRRRALAPCCYGQASHLPLGERPAHLVIKNNATQVVLVHSNLCKHYILLFNQVTRRADLHLMISDTLIISLATAPFKPERSNVCTVLFFGCNRRCGGTHLDRLRQQDLSPEAMLVKLKGWHFINAPSFIDKMLMLMRPFMKKELMDMLRIHQVGATSYDEFVPMEALPSDAGGCYMTLSECLESTIEKFKANNEYFIQENRKRVVESLRPGKPKTISDILGGVEGSFKKLDID